MTSDKIVSLFRMLQDGLDEQDHQLIDFFLVVCDDFEKVSSDLRKYSRDLKSAQDRIQDLEQNHAKQAALVAYYQKLPNGGVFTDEGLQKAMVRIGEIVQAPEGCDLNDIIGRVSLLKKIYDSQPGEDLQRPAETATQ